MNAHRLEVADVFRRHEDDFLARWGHVLSPQQRKAFADIRDCRTAVLGGHVEQYDCGHRVILYNSCTNRSCPKCQAAARAKWLAEREAELLPVDAYFHVVFTLPVPCDVKRTLSASWWDEHFSCALWSRSLEVPEPLRTWRGGGSDKKVNSYPMTSEDGQSG